MKATTVDEYLGSFEGQAREVLDELRELSRELVPEADEVLKWGNPAYVHPSGTILFAFGGHKQHANIVFTPSTREAFAAELSGFRTGKGSVVLPYGTAIPRQLLSRMIHYRIREHEDDGVLWK